MNGTHPGQNPVVGLAQLGVQRRWQERIVPGHQVPDRVQGVADPVPRFGVGRLGDGDLVLDLDKALGGCAPEVRDRQVRPEQLRTLGGPADQDVVRPGRERRAVAGPSHLDHVVQAVHPVHPPDALLHHAQRGRQVEVHEGGGPCKDPVAASPASRSAFISSRAADRAPADSSSLGSGRPRRGSDQPTRRGRSATPAADTRQYRGIVTIVSRSAPTPTSVEKRTS